MSRILHHEITLEDISESAQGLAIGAAAVLFAFSFLALSALLTFHTLGL